MSLVTAMAAYIKAREDLNRELKALGLIAQSVDIDRELTMHEEGIELPLLVKRKQRR